MSHNNHILIAGAGRIGQTLAAILVLNSNNKIVVADINRPKNFKLAHKNIDFIACDFADINAVKEIVSHKKINGIVSCLPYFLNIKIAEIARNENCHYFDVTEDVKATHDIFLLAEDAKTAFVPQCGVAPGLINIIASDLINDFQKQNNRLPESVKLYCGALPQKVDNALGYALNWSTDGLINEYINDSRILKNATLTNAHALTDLETINIQDNHYEAFNTSGGIGTLVETYQNQIQTMFYKTIRYPGHCEKMKFLLQDLKLKDDRKTLVSILENALPRNTHDFVIAHVTVDNLSATKIFHPTKISDIDCSAIQAVTSVSTAAVVNAVISHPLNFIGPIKQENFTLDFILENDLTGYLTNEFAK